MQCPNCSCKVFKIETWNVDNKKVDIKKCVYCNYILTQNIESNDMNTTKLVMEIQSIITKINSNIIKNNI